MAKHYLNVEWNNHNSQRKFPLAADASSKDLTGEFELPNDFLVALYLSIPASANVSPASFMLRTVQAFGTGLSITIGYWNGSEAVPVAAGSVLRATHSLYRAYDLRGLGDFYDARGSFTIGRLDNIDNQPPGEWQFNLDGGRLEPDVIRPQIRGVTQLRVQNGIDLSQPIVGDIVLRAGRNVRITPVLVSGEDPVIVFDAIEGEGLNDDCICEGDIELAPPIRTINGVPPTSDGRFAMVGNSCLELRPIAHGLQMNDTCSHPCCGCKELETITAQLEQFGAQATTLNNFVVSLEARVSQMDQVVLGSKLGDQGCSN